MRDFSLVREFLAEVLYSLVFVSQETVNLEDIIFLNLDFVFLKSVYLIAFESSSFILSMTLDYRVLPENIGTLFTGDFSNFLCLIVDSSISDPLKDSICFVLDCLRWTI